MTKFDYEYMSNDDVEMVVFNKDKYHKGIVLRLAIFESLDYIPEDLEIIESYVRYGFYQAPDGAVYNSWHIPETIRKTPPNKFEIPVWVVIPKEMVAILWH